MNPALAFSKINPLNQVLIAHVLNEARMGNYNHCRSLGFSDEVLTRLQNLSPCALTLLTHAKVVWIKPQVNLQLFERLLNRIHQEEQQMQVIQRALSLGAPNALMEHFFGFSHNETAVLRRNLGVFCRGRSVILTDSEKQTVWRRWLQLVRQVEKAEKAQSPTSGTSCLCHPCRAKRSKNLGQHLDACQQLDFMMLIAEEQSLSLASIWSELSTYLFCGQAHEGKQHKTPSTNNVKR